MNDNSKWANLRRHPRISWRFVVKFKPRDTQDLEWQVSTIKDISKEGCFFHSDVRYEIGQVLEIKIQFPAIRVPMEFIGEVKHCKSGGEGQFSLYGIGIYFLEMDEEKKKQFVETIAFFLRKKQK